MNYREILEDFVNNEDTEYCYDWHGFDYKIILPCIEQLLKNENNLQSKIDKVNRILNVNTHVENIYHALCNLFDKEYQYEIDNEELNEILKEDK